MALHLAPTPEEQEQMWRCGSQCRSKHANSQFSIFLNVNNRIFSPYVIYAICPTHGIIQILQDAHSHTYPLLAQSLE